MTTPIGSASGLFDGSWRTRYYSIATSSSSGTVACSVVVPTRCRYLGGWLVTNNLQASKVGDSFDVVSITAATSVTSGQVSTISSGVVITTSTGTFPVAFGGAANTAPTGASSALTLNAGDQICIQGSTGFGSFVTHIVREF